MRFLILLSHNAEVKSAINSMKNISSRDYDGIIVDLLDDIIEAETKAKRLIDRIDVISKRPSLRVINIDSYLWALASISIGSYIAGALSGYLIHLLLKWLHLS
jgi:hypothetical protein